jgi:uncharacterized phage-associated protein
MKTKCPINDVADYFIWFSQKHGDPITHLKLQKLCYYAEAYYWAIYNKPLTGEPFQAWTHGPVSRQLWEKYKGIRWEPITEKCKKPDLDKGICSYLQEIANVFSGYSAFQHEKMTHSDMPWKKARKGCSIEERCERVISTEDMKNYYKQYVTT